MIIESFFFSLFATDLTMLNVKNTVNWFHLCTLPILLISPTLSHADSTTVAFKARSRYLQNGKDVVKTVDVKWSAEKLQWLFAICGQAIGVIRHRDVVLKWHPGSMHSCLLFAPGVSSLFIAPVPA